MLTSERLTTNKENIAAEGCMGKQRKKIAAEGAREHKEKI
jgi:hypothetical protein